MRYNLCELHYKLPSDNEWTPMGLVPGSGVLDIDTADSKDGTVRTFCLSASLNRDHPSGPSWLTGDLRILAAYDAGFRVQLGTRELPVRLDVSGSNPLRITCNWQDTV